MSDKPDTRYRTHNELCNKVLLYLHSNFTGRFWGNPTGAVKTSNGHFQRYGLVGSTDIIGFTGSGRAVFIEVKTGKATLSPQQKIFQQVALSNNCLHIVIYNTIVDELFNDFPRRQS
jgi:hypothetical protein